MQRLFYQFQVNSKVTNQETFVENQCSRQTLVEQHNPHVSHDKSGMSETRRIKSLQSIRPCMWSTLVYQSRQLSAHHT